MARRAPLAVRSIGRYQVLGEVARGGMGAVLRARAPDGRPVAVKLLLASRGADATRRRRFELEVQALLRLDHPHLVRLLDAGEHEGVPYLVTEWVEGETLAARLGRAGPLDPRLAAELVRRVAEAVAHCHAQGILHRDLKPANVLLRASDGQPLLADLGLARDLQAGDASRPSLSGELLGTPGYWAPEQARGLRGQVGPATDVWGLGALLYGALTARPPLAGETLPEVWSAAEREVPPPSRLRPGIPPALDAVCARCLELDPARRPASAAEVAAALGRGPRAARAGSGHRALGAAALTVCSCAGLVSVWLLAPTSDAVPPERAASAGEPDLASLVSHTLDRLYASDHAQAAALISRVRAGGADQAQVLWLEGLLHMHRRELQPALAKLDRALALRPGSGQLHFHRGIVREGAGDLVGALADYDRSVALDPGVAMAWYNRGRLRERLGDLQGELLDYDRALELDPQLAVAWSNRSGVRGQLGDHAGAIEDATRAVELAPKNAKTWGNRGMARLNQGLDLPGARDDFTRALELDPDNPGYLLGRGQARRALGDEPGAIADLRRYLELQPDGIYAADVRQDLAALGAPSD